MPPHAIWRSRHVHRHFGTLARLINRGLCRTAPILRTVGVSGVSSTAHTFSAGSFSSGDGASRAARKVAKLYLRW